MKMMKDFSGLQKLFLAAISPAFILGGCQEKTEEEPLNVLWIIADDFSPDAGCYGNTLVKTPHIDQLAEKGVKYTNAFATNPVCSPSRSAFYTGMYQTTIGAHQHRTENRPELPEGIEVITEYFEEAGYFTSNGNGFPESKPGKTDFNFRADSIFDGSDWSQRAEGQPFFATVQIHYPHRSFESDSANPVDPAKVNLPPYYPDHPVSRKDWALYLESVQLLDERLGQILQRIDEEGLEDNTIVVFFADQGRPHLRAKQWLYDAGIHVPLIIRFPGEKHAGKVNEKLVSLIDLAPASLNYAGIQIPEHLQGIDFLNDTLMRNYIYAARNRTDAVVDHIRCVRGERYKYIRNYMPEMPYMQFGHYKAYRYPMWALMHVLNQRDSLTTEQALYMAPEKPAIEFYDTFEDPYEINNLAFNPNYKDIKDKMTIALNEWELQTNDPGSMDPDNYQELLQRRKEKYGERWAKRGFDADSIDIEAYLHWWENELGINRGK